VCGTFRGRENQTQTGVNFPPEKMKVSGKSQTLPNSHTLDAFRAFELFKYQNVVWKAEKRS